MKQAPATAVTPLAEFSVPVRRSPVLVVDADPAVRRILRLMFEGAGVPCLACASSADAAAVVSEHRPALVLAEVRLEPVGGQELASELSKGVGWKPKVALMSAYPRPHRGAEDFFVPKPIEFDQLMQLLEWVEQDSSSMSAVERRDGGAVPHWKT